MENIYRLKYLISLLVVIFSMPVIGSTINYNESISGDIDTISPFNLGFGNNTFNGTVSNGDNFDFDQIIFILPSDSKATFTFASEVINTGDIIPAGGFTWFLEQLSSPSDFPCGLLCGEQVFAGQSYSTISGSAGGFVINAAYDFNNLPLLTNDVYILHTAGSNGSVGFNFDMVYSAEINVQAVPLPSALILFISGFLLILSPIKKA